MRLLVPMIVSHPLIREIKDLVTIECFLGCAKLATLIFGIMNFYDIVIFDEHKLMYI